MVRHPGRAGGLATRLPDEEGEGGGELGLSGRLPPELQRRTFA